MSIQPIEAPQKTASQRQRESGSLLSRESIKKLERLDAKRDKLDREAEGLRAELAGLETSERDSANGGRGWTRPKADALLALRECRYPLYAHAERLYREAGAKYWRNYLDDMKNHHRVWSDGMFADANLDDPVELKVNSFGSEVETTKAAYEASLVDPQWLALKAIEAAYLADYRDISEKTHASRKVHAVADAQSLELQQKIIGILNQQTSIKNERNEVVAQLELARELERAGIPDAKPLDPANKSPEIFIDADGRPNVWVKRQKGGFEQPVGVKPRGGNVRFGNVLVMADGDELGWTLSWNRPHRVRRDVLSGPLRCQLVVMPQNPGDVPIKDVTGASTLYSEMDTTD